MRRIGILFLVAVFALSLTLTGCSGGSVFARAKLSENQEYMKKAQNEETREIIKNLEYLKINDAEYIGDHCYYYVDLTESLPDEVSIYRDLYGDGDLTMYHRGMQVQYLGYAVACEHDDYAGHFTVDYEPINDDIVNVYPDAFNACTIGNIVSLMYLDQAVGFMLNEEKPTEPFYDTGWGY